LELEADFKLIFARVKKAIRTEKFKYYEYSRLFDENYSDAKKYWEQ